MSAMSADMPDDVLIFVLSFCTTRMVCRASSVNARWRRRFGASAASSKFWHSRFLQDMLQGAHPQRQCTVPLKKNDGALGRRIMVLNDIKPGDVLAIPSDDFAATITMPAPSRRPYPGIVVRTFDGPDRPDHHMLGFVRGEVDVAYDGVAWLNVSEDVQAVTVGEMLYFTSDGHGLAKQHGAATVAAWETSRWYPIGKVRSSTIVTTDDGRRQVSVLLLASRKPPQIPRPLKLGFVDEDLPQLGVSEAYVSWAKESDDERRKVDASIFEHPACSDLVRILELGIYEQLKVFSSRFDYRTLYSERFMELKTWAKKTSSRHPFRPVTLCPLVGCNMHIPTTMRLDQHLRAHSQYAEKKAQGMAHGREEMVALQHAGSIVEFFKMQTARRKRRQKRLRETIRAHSSKKVHKGGIN